MNEYKHEELGKDHQKEVEDKKEAEREKRRQIITKQLNELDAKKRKIAKEMNIQNKTSIDLPSFVPKPSRKLEHKMMLLQQMEIDKEKRRLEKEANKLNSTIQPISLKLSEKNTKEDKKAIKDLLIKQSKAQELKKVSLNDLLIILASKGRREAKR